MRTSMTVTQAAACDSTWYPRLLVSICLAVTAALHSAPAPADEGLHEVIVTAQKREQRLQDVGVSITALQSDDLQSLGVTDTMQLGASVPGLQLNSATGGNYGAQLTIRGVAQSDYSPHQESPNSLYIDEVYVSAPNAQGAQIFDIQRIETLRGPQGTLFGRNATGGLVDIITNKPSAKPDAYVDVTAGEYNEVRVEAAAGGPLGNGLSGRLAVATQNNDGIFKNRLPGYPDINTTNFKGVRAALAWELTESLKALLSLSWSDDNDREGYWSSVPTFYDPRFSGRPAPLPANVNAWGTGPGNDLQGYRPSSSGADGTAFSYIGFMRRSILSPTLRVEWKLSGATLTSISNFTKLHFDYDEGCSGEPANVCHDPYKQEMKQWSQEVRLNGESGPLTWVSGVYGLGVNQNNRGTFNEPFYSGTPFAFSSYNLIEQKLTGFAVFGQIEYLFTPHWRGTLGLRATHDEKDFSSQAYFKEAGDFISVDTVYNPPLLVSDFSATTVGNLAKERNNNWSGKAQIDYIIGRNALLYASVSRGIKAAGFNANLTGGTANADVPFKAEHMYAYELGEKRTFLNDRLSLNSGVFFYDYFNYQAYQLRRGTSPFVSNSKARFAGGEIELAARPMHGLDVHLGIGGLSTIVKDVATAQVGVRDQLASDAPKWSGTGLVRYSWGVRAGVASLQWTADFVTDRYHSVDNTPSVLVHGSVGHNVRVGYAVANWEFSAFVNNLANKSREVAAYDTTASAGTSIHAYMAPRWWGGTVRYQF